MGKPHGASQTPDFEDASGISHSPNALPEGHELGAHAIFT